MKNTVEPCEHSDLDKHNQCLECGADLAEEILSSAIDRAMDEKDDYE